MHILLVSEDIPHPQMGGLAKHVLNLARALVQAGHEVDLLGGNAYPIEVAGEEGKFGGRFFGELDGQNVGWKEIKLGMFVPSRRTWLAKRFAKVILRYASSYDVIHYHGHAANIGHFIPRHINFVQTRHDQGSDCLFDTRFKNGQICRATNASDCASCRVAHPNVVQKTISTIAVKRYRAEVAEGFSRHKTIFVSDMLRKNFTRTMGGDHQRLGTVVHHFVDAASIEEARKFSRNAPETTKINAFVAGKLYAAKGVEAFLRELKAQQTSKIFVTIAGDGPDAVRLRNEFESDSIRFVGWSTPEKTLEMTALSNVVVVPSLWEEPFGSTTLEGLLLGKPTFALDRGATPELAVYASYPGQLRLHPDMHSLIQDLVNFSPLPASTLVPASLGSAERAIDKLLQIYTQAPGIVSGQECGAPSLLSDSVNGVW